MTTTITYEFNGRVIEEKSRTIEHSSIVNLINSLLDISDDHAVKPGYISICESYTYRPSLKSILYHRRVVTPRSDNIDIRAKISASSPTLRKASKYFKILGIMHSF